MWLDSFLLSSSSDQGMVNVSWNLDLLRSWHLLVGSMPVSPSRACQVPSVLGATLSKRHDVT